VAAIRAPVFDDGVAGNPPSMDDTDGVFRDDVPVADAVEQQRATGDAASDDADNEATPRLDEGEVPLEAAASDWQEQRETVEFDEADRY
jgi:hypothetical protein